MELFIVLVCQFVIYNFQGKTYRIQGIMCYLEVDNEILL